MQATLSTDEVFHQATYGGRSSGYQRVPEPRGRGSSHAPEGDALELSQPFQALALSDGERTPFGCGGSEYADSDPQGVYSVAAGSDDGVREGTAGLVPYYSDDDFDYALPLPPSEAAGRVVPQCERWDWSDVERPALTRPAGPTVVPGVNEQRIEGIPPLVVRDTTPQHSLLYELD